MDAEKPAEHRSRTAIFPVRLRRSDYQRAHDAAHISASLWNVAVEWVHNEWAAGRSPSKYDIRKQLTSIPASERPLHAHTIEKIAYDLADAITTYRQNKRQGLEVKPPWRTKTYRPLSFFAGFGWRVSAGALWLSLKRGRERIRLSVPQVTDPDTGAVVDPASWGEIRLCWDRDARAWSLHISVLASPAPALDPTKVVAIDEGIINPMALAAFAADSTTHAPAIDVTIISGREARAIKRERNKAVATVTRKRSRCKAGSRRDKALAMVEKKHRSRAAKRLHDLDHQVSHKAADFAVEHDAGKVVVGDVRGIEQRTRATQRHSRSQRQQLSQWSRGRQEDLLSYKLGTELVYIDESWSSKTCPACLARNRPKGRNYHCGTCGFAAPRDAVGAINILMATLHGRYTAIAPETIIRVKYLRAVPRWNDLQREAHRQVQLRRSRKAESDRARSNATNQATTTFGGRVTGALSQAATNAHQAAA